MAPEAETLPAELPTPSPVVGVDPLVPAKLIEELAIGLDDEDEVARRHGFEGERWAAIRGWKPFQDAIAAQRAEFDRDGYTYRAKARLRADALSDRLFVEAMGNDATMLQRLEVLRYYTRVADLEPKPTQPQAGSGFSITIQLGDNRPAARVVDVTPVGAV